MVNQNVHNLTPDQGIDLLVWPKQGNQSWGMIPSLVPMTIPEETAHSSCYPECRSFPGSRPFWSLILQLSQQFWKLAKVRFNCLELKNPNWHIYLIWGFQGTERLDKQSTRSPLLLQPKNSVINKGFVIKFWNITNLVHAPSVLGSSKWDHLAQLWGPFILAALSIYFANKFKCEPKMAP